MGSTMYAKLRALKPGQEISIMVDHAGHPVEDKDGAEVEISLHFSSTSDNFVSISGAWLVEGREDACPAGTPGYYTITCVADWMWFLLSLKKYFGDYIQIVECRPDPFSILQARK